MKTNKYLGIITREVITADEGKSAVEIAKLMKIHDIGVIIIMKNNNVAGIISERDITRRVVAENLNPESVTAKDIMTKNVVSVELKEGLNKLYKTLCEIKFRHLVIMDQGKLIGITSRRDLLDGLSKR